MSIAYANILAGFGASGGGGGGGGAVTSVNGATGAVTVAPVNSQFLVLAADGTLTSERVFTAGDGIQVTDNGAGNTFEVSLDIDGLTTENTIDTATDTIAFYDASAGVERKTALANIVSSSSAFSFSETPTGAVNGVNTIFTVANAPTSALKVYRNGQLQTPGTEYTVAGTTITFASAPLFGNTILVSYAYTGTSTAVVFSESPAGATNGVNTVFTAANVPSGNLEVYRNGQLQTPGTQYSVAGANITFASPPLTGNIILISYSF